MVVSSITISSYDTSINARFSYHPTFTGGTQTTLTPVSNNSGSSTNSKMIVVMNTGTVKTSNELVIADILYPANVTTFQIHGSIIVAPNTSIGFRGIAIQKSSHMALNVTWLEILKNSIPYPIAIFPNYLY